MGWLVLAVSLIGMVSPAISTMVSGIDKPSPSLGLDRQQAGLLAQWYEALGEPRSGEPFGDFLLRATSIKWHSPYADFPETADPESLRIDLARFDCLSFIDSSFAVARCAWRRDATEACFIGELVATRYRKGAMKTFAARLHYFEDWLDDNRLRFRLDDRTRDLGGVLLRRRFSYMSEHWQRFPPMADPRVREEIRLTEARLSKQTYAVIVRNSVRAKEALLQNGDLVGIVTTEPGRLISHVGLAVCGDQGRPRLLHASSHHRRVVLTSTGLADYILRRQNRWGIIVARPRPPLLERSLGTEEP